MKQRLSIARAMINNPKLLILDEPSRGLDLEGQLFLRDYIKEIKDKKCTVFINSHDLGEIQKISTKLAFIKNGQIIDCGTFHQLCEKYNESDLENIYRKILF